MSRFDSIFADHALQPLFDEHARQVVYRHPECDDVTLQAIVGDYELDPENAGMDREQMRSRFVTIATDPTNPQGGVAKVDRRGMFLITDAGKTEKWAVDAIQGKHESTIKIRVVSAPLESRGSENSGGRR